MAGYRDMLGLIRQGKSPEEILKTLSLCPSRLRRLLNSKRLNQQLELERDVSRKCGAYALGSGIHEMVRRCRELAEEGIGDTARKAAESLLEQAKQRLERTPNQELLISMVRKGQLSRSVLYNNYDDGGW